jgi:hypothetical protein
MRVQQVPDILPPFYHTAIVLVDDDNVKRELFEASPEDAPHGRYQILVAQAPRVPDPAQLDCEPRVLWPGRPVEAKSRILEEFAAEFNAQTRNLPYEFLGPNSNTYSRLALERLGVFGLRPSRPAPGWDSVLRSSMTG